MHTQSEKIVYGRLLIIFQGGNPEEIVEVEVDGLATNIRCRVVHGHLSFPISVRGTKYYLKVDHQKAKTGQSVTFTGKDGRSICVKISLVTKPVVKDDLHNYVRQFMQWYFLILSFKDAVKEGDIVRNNVHVKFLIPFFYGHSVLSKYMTECIDYVLKTEVVLSEKMAMRVRAASFVNTLGKQGDNKAADMQKENQVLVLKDLIRGLGANKTENAVITISKAASVIQSVVDNVDNMLCIKQKTTTHKKRSFKDDVQVLLEYIQTISPWTPVSDRKLEQFSGISRSPFNFETSLFNGTIVNTVSRLRRDLPEVDMDINNDGNDENSDHDE